MRKIIESKMVIYKITDQTNGMLYIGQTNNGLRLRWAKHIDDAKRERGNKCSRLWNALRAHGVRSFTVEVLEECSSRGQLNERESFWIAHLNTLSPAGYNLTSGGNASNRSEETRRKMAISKMGDKNPSRIYPYGAERRVKQSEAMMGSKNFNYGKKHTDEALAKMRAAKTPEVRARIAAASKKMWLEKRASGLPLCSKETRSNLSAVLKGRVFSAEHLRNLQIASDLRWRKRHADPAQFNLL